MTIDTERLRELAAELGFWPATPDEADIEHHRQPARTWTTGWPVIIDSITCAGNMSFGDSGRIQKRVVVELETRRSYEPAGRAGVLPHPRTRRASQAPAVTDNTSSTSRLTAPSPIGAGGVAADREDECVRWRVGRATSCWSACAWAWG
jgi:hypothetical protein